MAWKKYNKYGNQKTTIDGILFDSKREAARYQELRLLEQTGKIAHLKQQPVLILQDKFQQQGKTIRAITYKADFAYYDLETNQAVIEDVKGMETDVFRLKKKMFLKRYGDAYDFRIVR